MQRIRIGGDVVMMVERKEAAAGVLEAHSSRQMMYDFLHGRVAVNPV
jgi:hypothetical protein